MLTDIITTDVLYADIKAGEGLLYKDPVFMDNIDLFRDALHLATLRGYLNRERTEMVVDLIHRDLNRDRQNVELYSQIGEFVSDFTNTHKYHDWTSFITRMPSPLEKFIWLYSLYKYGDTHVTPSNTKHYIQLIQEVLNGQQKNEQLVWETPAAQSNLIRGVISLSHTILNDEHFNIMHVVSCINTLNIRTPAVWNTLSLEDKMNTVRLDFYNYRLLCDPEISRYGIFKDLLKLPRHFDDEDITIPNTTEYLKYLYQDLLPASFFVQLQLHTDLFDVKDLDLKFLTELFASAHIEVTNHPLPVLY